MRNHSFQRGVSRLVLFCMLLQMGIPMPSIADSTYFASPMRGSDLAQTYMGAIPELGETYEDFFSALNSSYLSDDLQSKLNRFYVTVVPEEKYRKPQEHFAVNFERVPKPMDPISSLNYEVFGISPDPSAEFRPPLLATPPVKEEANPAKDSLYEKAKKGLEAEGTGARVRLSDARVKLKLEEARGLKKSVEEILKSNADTKTKQSAIVQYMERVFDPLRDLLNLIVQEEDLHKTALETRYSVPASGPGPITPYTVSTQGERIPHPLDEFVLHVPDLDKIFGNGDNRIDDILTKDQFTKVGYNVDECSTVGNEIQFDPVQKLLSDTVQLQSVNNVESQMKGLYAMATQMILQQVAAYNGIVGDRGQIVVPQGCKANIPGIPTTVKINLPSDEERYRKIEEYLAKKGMDAMGESYHQNAIKTYFEGNPENGILEDRQDPFAHRLAAQRAMLTPNVKSYLDPVFYTDDLIRLRTPQVTKALSKIPKEIGSSFMEVRSISPASPKGDLALPAYYQKVMKETQATSWEQAFAPFVQQLKDTQVSIPFPPLDGKQSDREWALKRTNVLVQYLKKHPVNNTRLFYDADPTLKNYRNLPPDRAKVDAYLKKLESYLSAYDPSKAPTPIDQRSPNLPKMEVGLRNLQPGLEVLWKTAQKQGWFEAAFKEANLADDASKATEYSLITHAMNREGGDPHAAMRLSWLSFKKKFDEETQKNLETHTHQHTPSCKTYGIDDDYVITCGQESRDDYINLRKEQAASLEAAAKALALDQAYNPYLLSRTLTSAEQKDALGKVIEGQSELMSTPMTRAPKKGNLVDALQAAYYPEKPFYDSKTAQEFAKSRIMGSQVQTHRDENLQNRLAETAYSQEQSDADRHIQIIELFREGKMTPELLESITAGGWQAEDIQRVRDLNLNRETMEKIAKGEITAENIAEPSVLENISPDYVQAVIDRIKGNEISPDFIESLKGLNEPGLSLDVFNKIQKGRITAQTELNSFNHRRISPSLIQAIQNESVPYSLIDSIRKYQPYLSYDIFAEDPEIPLDPNLPEDIRAALNKKILTPELLDEILMADEGLDHETVLNTLNEGPSNSMHALLNIHNRYTKELLQGALIEGMAQHRAEIEKGLIQLCSMDPYDKDQYMQLYWQTIKAQQRINEVLNNDEAQMPEALKKFIAEAEAMSWTEMGVMGLQMASMIGIATMGLTCGTLVACGPLLVALTATSYGTSGYSAIQGFWDSPLNPQNAADLKAIEVMKRTGLATDEGIEKNTKGWGQMAWGMIGLFTSNVPGIKSGLSLTKVMSAQAKGLSHAEGLKWADRGFSMYLAGLRNGPSSAQLAREFGKDAVKAADNFEQSINQVIQAQGRIHQEVTLARKRIAQLSAKANKTREEQAQLLGYQEKLPTLEKQLKYQQEIKTLRNNLQRAKNKPGFALDEFIESNYRAALSVVDDLGLTHSSRYIVQRGVDFLTRPQYVYYTADEIDYAIAKAIAGHSKDSAEVFARDMSRYISKQEKDLSKIASWKQTQTRLSAIPEASRSSSDKATLWLANSRIEKYEKDLALIGRLKKMVDQINLERGSRNFDLARIIANNMDDATHAFSELPAHISGAVPLLFDGTSATWRAGFHTNTFAGLYKSLAAARENLQYGRIMTRVSAGLEESLQIPRLGGSGFMDDFQVLTQASKNMGRAEKQAFDALDQKFWDATSAILKENKPNRGATPGNLFWKNSKRFDNALKAAGFNKIEDLTPQALATLFKNADTPEKRVLGDLVMKQVTLERLLKDPRFKVGDDIAKFVSDQAQVLLSAADRTADNLTAAQYLIRIKLLAENPSLTGDLFIF